jgi:hypothetical protein
MTVLEVIFRCRQTEQVFRKYDTTAGVCLCCQALFDSLSDVAGKWLGLGGAARRPGGYRREGWDMMVFYVALLVLITAVLLGLLWWRRHASGPREVGWDEVMAKSKRGGYQLISTEEMADRYQRDPRSLLLVDTRPPAEYLAGHIRGAVNLPLTPTWWGRWRCKSLLAALLGPNKERLVVFY